MKPIIAWHRRPLATETWLRGKIAGSFNLPVDEPVIHHQLQLPGLHRCFQSHIKLFHILQATVPAVLVLHFQQVLFDVRGYGASSLLCDLWLSMRVWGKFTGGFYKIANILPYIAIPGIVGMACLFSTQNGSSITGLKIWPLQIWLFLLEVRVCWFRHCIR